MSQLNFIFKLNKFNSDTELKTDIAGRLVSKCLFPAYLGHLPDNDIRLLFMT